LAFVTLFALTLLGHDLRKKLMPPVAVIGGILGLMFLGIQHFQLHAFCKLCVVTDISSVLAAILAVLYARNERSGDDGRAPAGVWSVAAALACSVPFLFASQQASAQPQGDVPAGIAKRWVAGKVTIVEMSDFECPFCRLLHKDLGPTLEAYQGKVNFVRISVPLPSHKHARGASRAYTCARDQGKGEEMADALFTADDLTEAGWMKIAENMSSKGLNVEAFKACVADTKTDARVGAEESEARSIGFKGLPTMWIGRQALLGAQPSQEIRKVIDKEISGTQLQKRLPTSYLWGFLGLLGLLLAGFSLTGAKAKRV
jgi:protein-disulfide isomerase